MVDWIQKVRSHGIQGELANWMQNWLGESGVIFFRLEACDQYCAAGIGAAVCHIY